MKLTEENKSAQAFLVLVIPHLAVCESLPQTGVPPLQEPTSSAPVPVHSVQPVLQSWSLWSELVETRQDGPAAGEQLLRLLSAHVSNINTNPGSASCFPLLNLTLSSLALALRSSRSTARSARCIVSSSGTVRRNQEVMSSRSLFRCCSSQHPLTPGREQTLSSQLFCSPLNQKKRADSCFKPVF